MARYIDIHILQTLPPSNSNRDNTGAPKATTFGRARCMHISSQAIKRATRLDFEQSLPDDNRGVQTKRIVELLRDMIVEKRADLEDRATQLTELTLTEIGFKILDPKGKRAEQQMKKAGFLVFLSTKQVEHVVGAVTSVADEEDVKKAFKALKPRSLVDTGHSVDIALFGHMVAEPNSLNVDAACQVTHALDVGQVESEFDYLTAVDDAERNDNDANEDAGMIGTIKFVSATLYRYATINIDLLVENLGSLEAAEQAIEIFIGSFLRSVPTGRLTTFANRTLPDAVLIQVRDDQPVNLAGALESPIRPDRDGFVVLAVEQFIVFEHELEEGSGMRPLSSFVSQTTSRAVAFAELGQRVPLAELGTTVMQSIRGAR